jgi:hypothetical protein
MDMDQTPDPAAIDPAAAAAVAAQMDQIIMDEYRNVMAEKPAIQAIMQMFGLTVRQACLTMTRSANNVRQLMAERGYIGDVEEYANKYMDRGERLAVLGFAAGIVYAADRTTHTDPETGETLPTDPNAEYQI